MKIYIDTDEWYPIFSPLPAPENPEKHKYYNLIEVSDDLIPRWKKLTNEFNAFQDELMALKNTPVPKPEPVLIPLDIDDIRATDEFKPIHGTAIYSPLFWDNYNVKTVIFITYADLAVNYRRRQHGSNEWKPCTKEAK